MRKAARILPLACGGGHAHYSGVIRQHYRALLGAMVPQAIEK
jgi:hypothetical protein